MACLYNLLKIMPVTEWTSYGLGFLCPELQKEASGLPSPRRGQSLTVCTEHDGHGPGAGGGLEHLISLSVHGRPLYFIFTVNTLVNYNKGVQSMLLEV
eukprot:bmy_18578T0